jgi:hypothetical protein
MIDQRGTDPFLRMRVSPRRALPFEETRYFPPIPPAAGERMQAKRMPAGRAQIQQS